GDPAIHPIPTSLHGNGVTPRGIIGVDIFGLPADYDRIQDIADRENMFVVGDAAQSFGGEWKGRKAGSLGNVGCTSFFPAKPLGCFGDGGAVFTDDTELAGIMESIRVHGKGTDKYDNVRVGLNARLDTLQAAVLLSKLAIFPKELDLRDEVADRYDELLAPLAPKITTPARVAATRSAWAQYSLLAESGDMRAACQAALKDAGAPTAIYYPKPLHLQTAFKYLGYEPGHMEVSEDAATRIFSLPMHPYLKAEQAEMVAKALAQAVA
ncbi:MAG: aminotransferase DegT, partial [Desulfovibrio sp.]